MHGILYRGILGLNLVDLVDLLTRRSLLTRLLPLWTPRGLACFLAWYGKVVVKEGVGSKTHEPDGNGDTCAC